MKSIIRITLALIIVNSSLIIANAQVAINSDGASPDASAMLDVTSTSKGLLVPRMDSTSRQGISNPANGLLVFDTNFNAFWYYTSSTWFNLNAAMTDADGDTKIQIEENPDEDIIRFDLNGTEFMRLDSGHIEILNTGGSIFIGEDAGASDDFSGNNHNIFIGRETGYSNTTGYYNIFQGSYAGYSNTSGFNNTFIGVYAGQDNTTGYRNIFIGYKSGEYNTTGYRNTFIGEQTGLLNNTGFQNTYIGYQAGYSGTNSESNIFIGYKSGFNETGSNKLYIENSSSSSPLLYGEFDNDLLQINGTLNIKGEYDFPITDGSANQVLSTDGSGTLSWTDITDDQTVDVFSISNNTLELSLENDGQSNYSVDLSSYLDNTDDQTVDVFSISNNTLELSLENDGQSNYSVDLSSYLDNTDDQTVDVFSISNNTLALSLENDGQSNYSVDLSGYLDNTDDQTIDVLSFSSNTLSISLEDDGESNQTVDLTMSSIEDNGGDTKVDVGSSNQISFDLGGTEYFRMDGPRLKVLNSGSSVFIGENAGENDDLSTNLNIAIGTQALQNNSSGTGNIGIGIQALQANTSSSNTVIGTYAAYQATGGNNVIMGYDAAQNLTSGSGNVIIGKSAGGSSNISNRLFIDNSNDDAPLIYGEFDNNILEFNGKVGIGTTPTNGKLEINGSVDKDLTNYTYVNNSNNDVVYIGYTVTDREISIYASDRIVGKYVISLSDERIKDIQGISDSKKDLDILNQIEITDYKFIDKVREGNTKQKKVIAQQVAEVFPQAVEKQITEIIPDIYQTATIDENGWVVFNEELGIENVELKVGDKIQIFFEDKKKLLEILEVNENTFRVKSPIISSQPSTVFVYGRQVHDFHTVDYQAISMLNVSATQQLAKENEALKVENQRQQAEIDALKAQLQKVNELEAKLEAFINNSVNQ